MKANIDKYFISANAVDDIPESHYQKLEPVLQTIEAFTRNTNKVVYVVDYLKKNFLYSSAGIEELCGITKEEMKRYIELGIDLSDIAFTKEIRKKEFQKNQK